MLISAFYPTEFQTNWEHLLQQTDSRFLPNVVRSDFNGKKKWFNQITPGAMQRITNRKDDTRDGEFDAVKYWMTQVAYDEVTIFDEFDDHLLGQIVLPTSDEVKKHAMAANRTIDDVIIAAADGTRYIGEEGTTADPLPAAQDVAVNFVENGTAVNSGLTIGKLRQAKFLMDEDEVPEDGRMIAVAAKQIQDLLRTTEVTSDDYNTVKALAKGQIDTFLGFKFINSQRLTLDSGDIRRVIAWHKDGLKFAMGERKVKMDIRPDKNHALQIRTVLMVGAVRTENEKVVRIYCDQSP